MANKPGPTEMCRHLGRMITSKLSECLEDTADCPYRVLFGGGYFCTSKLNGRSDRSARKATRNREYETESWDS